MPQTATNLKDSVGVIVRRGDEILVGLRKGSTNAGQWGLPGGKPEPGETPFQAALRELAEENGVQVRNLRLLKTMHIDHFPELGLRFATRFVICDWTGGEPQILEPGKCAEWRWVRWDDLPEPMYAGLLRLRATGIDWARY